MTRRGQAAAPDGAVCAYCLVEIRPRHAALSWLGAAFHARCLDALLDGSWPRRRDKAA